MWMSHERGVFSGVPACLLLAMLSCNDEWAHTPDRNLADPKTVCSDLSVLLEFSQNGGGHTYKPKDRKHPLDSQIFCMWRSSRGLRNPWWTPSCLHLPAECPLCDTERHSFHFLGTLCCILGNIHCNVSIGVAPVNAFVLSNSMQLFEREGHIQDFSVLGVLSFISRILWTLRYSAIEPDNVINLISCLGFQTLVSMMTSTHSFSLAYLSDFPSPSILNLVTVEAQLSLAADAL
jgi:hypothetical protein